MISLAMSLWGSIHQLQMVSQQRNVLEKQKSDILCQSRRQYTLTIEKGNAYLGPHLFTVTTVLV